MSSGKMLATKWCDRCRRERPVDQNAHLAHCICEECVLRGRLESTEAKCAELLAECREWLDVGGRTGSKLGYVEFRKRLGAALGKETRTC